MRFCERRGDLLHPTCLMAKAVPKTEGSRQKEIVMVIPDHHFATLQHRAFRGEL